MRCAFNALPTKGRRLLRLVVDWAKRSQVCYDRTGGVGTKLKAVHWSMLVVAWWSYRVNLAGPGFHDAIELGCLLFEVFRFYGN